MWIYGIEEKEGKEIKLENNDIFITVGQMRLKRVPLGIRHAKKVNSLFKHSFIMYVSKLSINVKERKFIFFFKSFFHFEMFKEFKNLRVDNKMLNI